MRDFWIGNVCLLLRNIVCEGSFPTWKCLQLKRNLSKSKNLEITFSIPKMLRLTIFLCVRSLLWLFCTINKQFKKEKSLKACRCIFVRGKKIRITITENFFHAAITSYWGCKSWSKKCSHFMCMQLNGLLKNNIWIYPNTKNECSNINNWW